MRKPWSKPKLVVLIRGKPEETVMQTCKGAGLTGPGTDNVECVSTSVCRPCAWVRAS
jgi:hypothetical protein